MNRERHVVVCNWRDPGHPQAGGAELWAWQVATRFVRDGSRVTYLTERHPGSSAAETVDGVNIRRVGNRFTLYPAAAMWLARHRHRIDAVIDCHNGIGYHSPLVVPAGVPVVAVVHHVHQDQFAMHFPGPVAGFGRFVEKVGYRWMYRRRPVAAVSPSTAEEIGTRLKWKNPVYLAPNGVTVPEVDPIPAGRKAVDIVCVGRLVPHKRVDLALDAAAALGASILVIGDGPDRERLENHAVSLGMDPGKVFLGRVDEVTKARTVAAARVHVAASTHEGWGLTVLEAAALGTPTIAYDVPGLRDSVLDRRTGWLLDSRTSLTVGIAAALVELDDPDRAERISGECVQWAERFTWEATYQRIVRVLENEKDRLAAGRDATRGPGCVIELGEGARWEGPVPNLTEGDVMLVEQVTSEQAARWVNGPAVIRPATRQDTLAFTDTPHRTRA